MRNLWPASRVSVDLVNIGAASPESNRSEESIAMFVR